MCSETIKSMKNFRPTNIVQIWRKIVASFVLVAFLLTSGGVPAYSQVLLNLPEPGTRVSLSPAFMPPLLKGIKVYPDNPFKLDFILDKGDSSVSSENLKAESTRLIKYFLASITVPEKDLWVNLSPYEKDRIIPNGFGVTEMGRDLLAQDYILKQITASVIYPEGEFGKAFWAKVYVEAQKRYGTSDVPVDTFNKVWVVPEKAVVYESKDSAYVVESKLKVMLEEDYLALETNTVTKNQSALVINKLGSDIVREVVIPILEKEVNEGKNFARLRQVYHSLILAIWYKDKVKESILGKAYVDQKKTGGVDIEDKTEKEKIWAKYVEAFQKGTYNYIKEETDSLTQGVIPRKYFSGGESFVEVRNRTEIKNVARDGFPYKDNPNNAMIISADMAMTDGNQNSGIEIVRELPAELKDGLRGSWFQAPMQFVYGKPYVRSMMSAEIIGEVRKSIASGHLKEDVARLESSEVQIMWLRVLIQEAFSNSESQIFEILKNVEWQDPSDEREFIRLLVTLMARNNPGAINVAQDIVQDRKSVLRVEHKIYAINALVTTARNQENKSLARWLVTEFIRFYGFISVEVSEEGSYDEVLDRIVNDDNFASEVRLYAQGLKVFQINTKTFQELSKQFLDVYRLRPSRGVVGVQNSDVWSNELVKVAVMSVWSVMFSHLRQKIDVRDSSFEYEMRAIMDYTTNLDGMRHTANSAYNFNRLDFIDMECPYFFAVVAHELGHRIEGHVGSYMAHFSNDPWDIVAYAAYTDVSGTLYDFTASEKFLPHADFDSFHYGRIREFTAFLATRFFYYQMGWFNEYRDILRVESKHYGALWGDEGKRKRFKEEDLLHVEATEAIDHLGKYLVSFGVAGSDLRLMGQLFLVSLIYQNETHISAFNFDQLANICKSLLKGTSDTGSGTPKNDALTSNSVKRSTSIDMAMVDETVAALFVEYMRNDDGLKVFVDEPLRQAFTPEIMNVLLRDRSLRPVFMVSLDEGAGQVGPLQGADMQALERLGGIDLLQSHSSFLVGNMHMANEEIKRGRKIIVGVTDRHSDRTLMRGIEVANGRQVFFPLPDGTWLGVKGSGNFRGIDVSVPYQVDKDLGKVWGLASEVEAKDAERSRDELKGKDFLAVQFLGYRTLNVLPDGKGNLSAIAPGELVDGFQPALVFNRVFTPHRVVKLPQLLEEDHGLRVLYANVVKALENNGFPVPATPDDMLLNMLEQMAVNAAFKHNNHLYKATFHLQDVLFSGHEADNEEWRTYEQIFDKVTKDRFFEYQPYLLHFLEKYKINLAELSFCFHLMHSLAENMSADERANGAAARLVRGFMSKYFSKLNNENLNAWIDEYDVIGYGQQEMSVIRRLQSALSNLSLRPFRKSVGRKEKAVSRPLQSLFSLLHLGEFHPHPSAKTDRDDFEVLLMLQTVLEKEAARRGMSFVVDARVSVTPDILFSQEYSLPGARIPKEGAASFGNYKYPAIDRKVILKVINDVCELYQIKVGALSEVTIEGIIAYAKGNRAAGEVKEIIARENPEAAPILANGGMLAAIRVWGKYDPRFWVYVFVKHHIFKEKVDLGAEDQTLFSMMIREVEDLSVHDERVASDILAKLYTVDLGDANTVKEVDSSMAGVVDEELKGGIDLTRDKMSVQVKGAGGVQFNFDPAMIQQLQNSAGLTPVIIDIRPMTTSVPVFLGLREGRSATLASVH